MYKIIEQLCVTTREENGHGYVIAHEKTHTKAYQTQLQKAKDRVHTNLTYFLVSLLASING